MKKKGISLVVLIITIVVMIILASAVISNITDTDLIGNAKDATVKMRGSEVESYINLWQSENILDEYLKGSTKSEEDILNELIDKKLVYEDEIDRENNVIIIGDKTIEYGNGSTDNTIHNPNNIFNRIGMCWTLGNSLDNDSKRLDLTVEDYETGWDNPVTTNELIKAVKDSGFYTIRIPVTWFNHLDDQNKVDEAWMTRVKEVVDYAINNDMIVILDVHHDDKLLNLQSDKSTFAKVIDKYSYIWEQIANTFKSYDQRLIFEIINEPRVILEDGSSEWNTTSDVPYENLNNFYAKMVQTIRSTGGRNSNRYLLLPTYGTLITREVLEKLKLPNDLNLAIAVHGYLPYEYCSDSTLPYTEDMYESIKYKIDLLAEYSKVKNVPIVISELGCYEKSDRSEWLRDIYSYCTYKDVKLALWDNGDGYKIFDRNALRISDTLAFNAIKKAYENVKEFKGENAHNLTEGVNTTTNVSKDNSNMEVKVVDGKNHYLVNTTLTSSCRFKFADVYELDDEYRFFEFSYKVKTDMSQANIKLVINFMDEYGNVMYKVDYADVSKEIDGTKSVYEIKKMYRVKGAKKVQIERFSVSPYTSEGQDVKLEMYDIQLKAF